MIATRDRAWLAVLVLLVVSATAFAQNAQDENERKPISRGEQAANAVYDIATPLISQLRTAVLLPLPQSVIDPKLRDRLDSLSRDAVAEFHQLADRARKNPDLKQEMINRARQIRPKLERDLAAILNEKQSEELSGRIFFVTGEEMLLTEQPDKFFEAFHTEVKLTPDQRKKIDRMLSDAVWKICALTDQWELDHSHPLALLYQRGSIVADALCQLHRELTPEQGLALIRMVIPSDDEQTTQPTSRPTPK